MLDAVNNRPPDRVKLRDADIPEDPVKRFKEPILGSGHQEVVRVRNGNGAISSLAEGPYECDSPRPLSAACDRRNGLTPPKRSD